MITTLVCAILCAQAPVQVPVQKTIPFAWERAAGARVEVKELVRKVPFEYDFDLKVHLDGDGTGVVLGQSGFDLKVAAKLDLTKPAVSAQMREWRVQKKHTPAIRVDEHGAFEEFSKFEEVFAKFFDELTEGQTAQQKQVAGMNYATPSYKTGWIDPLRKHFYRWAELWTGLPCQTGSRSVKRRAFLNLPWIAWMDVVSEVEVSEPFVEDGRELIRVQSQFSIDDTLMGQHWIAFMRSLNFTPSNIMNLKSYNVVFTDIASFDTETWLPVEMYCKVESTMNLETSRAKWEENAAEEHRYRFTWNLRESGK